MRDAERVRYLMAACSKLCALLALTAASSKRKGFQKRYRSHLLYPLSTLLLETLISMFLETFLLTSYSMKSYEKLK